MAVYCGPSLTRSLMEVTRQHCCICITCLINLVTDTITVCVCINVSVGAVIKRSLGFTFGVCVCVCVSSFNTDKSVDGRINCTKRGLKMTPVTRCVIATATGRTTLAFVRRLYRLRNTITRYLKHFQKKKVCLCHKQA